MTEEENWASRITPQAVDIAAVMEAVTQAVVEKNGEPSHWVAEISGAVGTWMRKKHASDPIPDAERILMYQQVTGLVKDLASAHVMAAIAAPDIDGASHLKGCEAAIQQYLFDHIPASQQTISPDNLLKSVLDDIATDCAKTIREHLPQRTQEALGGRG